MWVQAGIERNIIGTPHRVRLNLLVDLLELPLAALFHKIKSGSELPEEYVESGDFIGHLGTSFSHLPNYAPSNHRPQQLPL